MAVPFSELFLKFFSVRTAAIYENIDACQVSVAFISHGSDGVSQFLRCSHPFLRGKLDQVSAGFFFQFAHAGADKAGAQGADPDALRPVFISAFPRVPGDKVFAERIGKAGFVILGIREIRKF